MPFLGSVSQIYYPFARPCAESHFDPPIGLLAVYGGSDMAAYLVRFVTNLDPNVGESTRPVLAPIRRDHQPDHARILRWVGNAGVDDGHVSCRSDGVFDERDVGESAVTKKERVYRWRVYWGVMYVSYRVLDT